jgi:nitroimidazol reductase NimA-like FMN-containing flavoprotein (pyridoxamine 5'-phosphate oxidase superfamily)
VCVTVTHLDGLVCARSVFNHSMNYRSAMIFGVARLVTDPAERTSALRVITEHLAPGQWSYARPPTRKELAATSVLALPLAEASVKVRSGEPEDEPRTTRWTSGRAWCR